MKKILKIAVVVVGVVGLVYGLKAIGLTGLLGGFVERLKEMGPLGAALLAIVYVPVCLAAGPAWLLTLGAGYAFGPVVGTLAVIAGSNGAAQAAFLLGKTIARKPIEKRIAGNAKFAAIDQAVAKQGFKIVLLTRLSPIFPFTLLNYAYGVTKVGYRDYATASLLGMLPGTVMYVYLGSAVKNIQDILDHKVQGGAGGKVLFGVGLALTVVVTVYVTGIARKALAEAIPGSAPGVQPAA